jgi:hypothetical protein
MDHGINNLLERLFKPCLRNMPKAKEDDNSWKAHLVDEKSMHCFLGTFPTN